MTQDQDAPARIGEHFAGRYRLDALLGEGGMGVVYRATRLEDDHPVAIKLILKSLTTNATIVERFRREVRISARLDSPFTVDVLEHGETDDGEHFLVMELLDGRPLRDLLMAGQSFNAGRVVRIGSQVAQALAAAHALGVVHRDLKPENVFVWDRVARPGRPTEHDRVKILDFGVARLVDNGPDADPDDEESRWQTLTRQGAMVGTLHYMSPEQVTAERLTPAADLYALGVVLYEMVCGQPPYICETPREALNAHLFTRPEPLSKRAPGRIPPSLEALILQLLEKDPAARPASAQEVAVRLADALVQTEPEITLPPPEPMLNLNAGGGRTLVPDVETALDAPEAPPSPFRSSPTMVPDVDPPEPERLGSSPTIVPDVEPPAPQPLGSSPTIVPDLEPSAPQPLGSSPTIVPDFDLEDLDDEPPEPLDEDDDGDGDIGGVLDELQRRLSERRARPSLSLSEAPNTLAEFEEDTVEVDPGALADFEAALGVRSEPQPDDSDPETLVSLEQPVHTPAQPPAEEPLQPAVPDDDTLNDSVSDSIADTLADFEAALTARRGAPSPDPALLEPARSVDPDAPAEDALAGFEAALSARGDADTPEPTPDDSLSDWGEGGSLRPLSELSELPDHTDATELIEDRHPLAELEEAPPPTELAGELPGVALPEDEPTELADPELIRRLTGEPEPEPEPEPAPSRSRLLGLALFGTSVVAGLILMLAWLVFSG
ncbi:MAG: protein kinase [Alphaproteobacteria bacterium]|nr:protein kinase [Alphaproteobacteria bacterium]